MLIHIKSPKKQKKNQYKSYLVSPWQLCKIEIICHQPGLIQLSFVKLNVFYFVHKIKILHIKIPLSSEIEDDIFSLLLNTLKYPKISIFYYIV